jgi:hypothetical protein
VFGSNFGNQSRILLDQAMLAAQQHIPALDTAGLNTEVHIWTPGPMYNELTQVAQQRNIQAYHGQGLTVPAAPGKYGFTSKIDRILLRGD